MDLCKLKPIRQRGWFYEADQLDIFIAGIRRSHEHDAMRCGRRVKKRFWNRRKPSFAFFLHGDWVYVKTKNEAAGTIGRIKARDCPELLLFLGKVFIEYDPVDSRIPRKYAVRV